MNTNKFIVAILALVFLAGRADAAMEDSNRIDPETLAPLAAWVEQATNVQFKALPITTASNSRLQTALGLEGVQHARAAAAYLPGQIVISENVWDPDSIRAQSYLVHELVHHAQLVSRKEYPCHAAKEREAYTLQNQWLEQHGQPDLVSQEWIDRIAACNSDQDDGETE